MSYEILAPVSDTADNDVVTVTQSALNDGRKLQGHSLNWTTGPDFTGSELTIQVGEEALDPLQINDPGPGSWPLSGYITDETDRDFTASMSAGGDVVTMHLTTAAVYNG